MKLDENGAVRSHPAEPKTDQKRSRKRKRQTQNITAYEWASRNPGHGFVADGPRILRCALPRCNCTIALDFSTIRNRIESKKHKAGMDERKRPVGVKPLYQTSFREAAARMQTPPAGSVCVPDAEINWRVDILDTFLITGTPMSRIGGFSKVLNKFRLPDERALTSMLPMMITLQV